MIDPKINETASRGLAALHRALGDMTEPNQEIGEVMIQSTKDRFPQGIAPDGTPWAPKSQATIQAQRRGEGRGRNARVDFRPLFGPSRSLSTQISYIAGPDSVEWGSNLIYAGVQQLGAGKGAFGTMSNGSPIPWGQIPARPFLGLSTQDNETIVATVEDWLGRVADGPS